METTEPTEDDVLSLIVADPAPEAKEDQEADETELAEAEEVEAENVEDDAEAPPEPDKAERYTVTVDGEVRKVSFEELKRGYAGQAYIQKGMQAVAEKAKALDSEREALFTFVESLKTQGGVIPQPVPPDPAKLEKDPIGYMREQAKYLQDAAAWQEQQEQLAELQSKREAAKHQSDAEAIAACEEALVKAVPDLADPVKGKPLMEAIRKGALEYGYTLEDLQQTRDPRAFLMALDAGRYRAMLSKKAEVTARVAQPAQKVLKPSGQTVPVATAQQNLSRGVSGDDEAWTRYLRGT